MPKQKSHRGAAKRFKITGGGKVMRSHSMANHILTKKTTKRKRNLRRQAVVSPGFARIIKRLLEV